MDERSNEASWRKRRAGVRSFANFIAIPKASKNKERAMMFLDWVNANEENYTLVEHGVEGTD
ncbi:hypothetical protein ACFPYJ_08430 [Paenibacillus solisilvae]|uniref:Extracellular solute-binding protein n=1 Tax=Paenibacillus solisilvae TaxID=2486751 RepID=A0ABW0VTF3_9BACL